MTRMSGNKQRDKRDPLKSLKTIKFRNLYDRDRPIKISSDACKDGLGAVLLQLHEKEWKLVAFASRAMTSAETLYAD